MHFKVKSSNIGYPRIGDKREWKKKLEAYWAGSIDSAALENDMKAIRLHQWKKQQEAGIDMIPVGDFSLYDHMLDMAVLFGLVPERFGHSEGEVPLDVYFAMARGSRTASACEMTKWFNTNYHYIVPEWEGKRPYLTNNRLAVLYREAKESLGIDGKPVLVGPFTFLKLSKGYAAADFSTLLRSLLPLYGQVLQELEQEGASWVQLDEPSLNASMTEEEMSAVEEAYRVLNGYVPNMNLLLQTYFDAVEYYDRVINLPVQGIGLDFVHDRSRNLEALKRSGFPADKWLAAGVIDGRNIWRSRLQESGSLLKEIGAEVASDRLIIQPSCSLLHVPVSLDSETELPPVLQQAMAYADEKLEEINWLVETFPTGAASEISKLALAKLEASEQAWTAISRLPERALAADTVKESSDSSLKSQRPLPFAERRPLQQAAFNLPLLPTTTIGSFPQTAEVRKARNRWRKGEMNKESYDNFIRSQIREWVAIQEEIGLDVLVHGEFERTDMVEFFGEKLEGFAFTKNGWVQSYGSRCVKPPVIYGNVGFSAPMTVEETIYAQSLTKKPVKGMLTGPVTILNWSFVRDDISRKEVAWQIARALRQEVEELERNGIKMIQVDEPALREGLPLKEEDKEEYLEWAVEAFKLTTSSVENTTQIHTHMCYCEFHDLIDSIRGLDADVISIETSRSHGELLTSFETRTYDKGIGLGVYDIHSPRVPEESEMISMINRALSVLPASLFWINPDCGLKTRGPDETVSSLKNMVNAAALVRKSLQV